MLSFARLISFLMLLNFSAASWATSVKVGYRQAFIRKTPQSDLSGVFCFLRLRFGKH